MTVLRILVEKWIMQALADLRQARVDGRCLIIEGEICPETVENFQLQAERAYQNIPEDDLIIEINTPGGDLACMNVLFSEISVLAANDKLWIVGRGLVASAGLYLLGAVPREKRVALPYTKFFHHPAQFSFSVSKTVKSKKRRRQLERDWLAYLKASNHELDRRARELVKTTEISLDKFNKMEAKSTYLTEVEAMRIGLIDHILI